MKKNIFTTTLLTTCIGFSVIGTSWGAWGAAADSSSASYWGDGSQLEPKVSVEIKKQEAKKRLEAYYQQKNEEIRKAMEEARANGSNSNNVVNANNQTSTEKLNQPQKEGKFGLSATKQYDENNRKDFYENHFYGKNQDTNNLNINSSDNNNIQGKLDQYMNDGQYKFKDGEEKPSKTLFCLIVHGRGNVSNCKPLLKDFYKMVANPKKYGNPQKFLNKSAIRNGNLQKHSEELQRKQVAGMTGAPEDKQYMIDLNNQQLKIGNAYIDKLDYTYHWDGKSHMFSGSVRVDGDIIPNNFYTCDTSPITGLNNKLDVKEERYMENGLTRFRYYLRTLTKMPNNCLALKHYYPKTTALPKYNTERCDGRYYDERDYMRGYYEVKDAYGNLVQHKIEKDCWDSEKIEEEKMKVENEAALKEITNEIFKNKYSSKKAAIMYFNYYAPDEFKLPVTD